MANESLMWLQEWYLNQCDGDWEHEFGIVIETLDNPGWRLEIDLRQTDLESARFEPMRVERAEHDWIFCEVSEGKFKASCGPKNLGEAIEMFRKWGAEHAFQRRKQRRLGG
ncbi:MAG: immunity 53 family protein [Deltaproteobacteria bacterium]|nr:immunity 53 family protein [Deltaproteobacteria bacterium]